MPDRTGALIEAAGTLGTPLDAGQAARLLEFAELVERANRAFNLISRQDVDRLVSRHLLDSLSVAPLLPGGSVMDLGTGGGLPGVPLAIARTDLRFTLVDRSERKVRFVQRAIRELGIDNVTVRCLDLAPGATAVMEEAPFDAVVSRAVTDPARLWRLAAGHLSCAGVVLVMHRGQRPAGPREPSRTPLPAPPGARVVAEREVDIPGLPDPHGIVVLGRAVAYEGE